MYYSTKTFEHSFSCAFRQWRAESSHCRFVHGYALTMKFTFEADGLDYRNWVIDFGGVKLLKKKLDDSFDHKLVIAADDPQYEMFARLHEAGVADMVTLPAVGVERFAQHAYQLACAFLREIDQHTRVSVYKVEVWEHGGNSAVYPQV